MTDKSPLSRYLKCKNRDYAVKAFSERPHKKNEAEWTSKGNSKEIPETITYLLMKEKF
jgi:hypothetical protein